MRAFLAGVLTMLLLGGGAFMVWQVSAEDPAPLPDAPPPPEPDEAPLRGEVIALPKPAAGAMKAGPPPPDTKAYELNKEEKRFNRYDRDRDNYISRVEMLSTRTNAFRKLDGNGDNLLTFEEWAVGTAQKFGSADGNKDKILTRDEFASTRPKPSKKKAGCAC